MFGRLKPKASAAIFDGPLLTYRIALLDVLHLMFQKLVYGLFYLDDRGEKI